MERSTSEKRAPSAKKFKSYLWRPIAAVSLIAASHAFTESQSTPDVSHLSMLPSLTPFSVLKSEDIQMRPLSPQQQYLEIQKEKASPQDPVTLSEFPSLYPTNGPLPTKKNDHRTDCDAIFGTDYESEKERDYYLENCNSEEQVKDRIKDWLIEAGWPEELLDQAVEVTYGCESGGDPGVISENGLWKGLFQLDDLWFDYSGEDPEQWADPVVNARAALGAYNYDIKMGHKPWAQWGCKPTSLTTP